jgi:hypothetical protein
MWLITLSVAPSIGACGGGMPWGCGAIGMGPGGMPGSRPACCRQAAASTQQQHADRTTGQSHITDMISGFCALPGCVLTRMESGQVCVDTGRQLAQLLCDTRSSCLLAAVCCSPHLSARAVLPLLSAAGADDAANHNQEGSCACKHGPLPPPVPVQTLQPCQLLHACLLQQRSWALQGRRRPGGPTASSTMKPAQKEASAKANYRKAATCTVSQGLERGECHAACCTSIDVVMRHHLRHCCCCCCCCCC